MDTPAAHQGVLWTRQKGEPALCIWGLGLPKVWGAVVLETLILCFIFLGYLEVSWYLSQKAHIWSQTPEGTLTRGWWGQPLGTAPRCWWTLPVFTQPVGLMRAPEAQGSVSLPLCLHICKMGLEAHL